MSELTLMILRIGFLLVLWAFIFAIVYALRSDLFGAPVRKLKGDSANAPHVQPIVAAAPVVAAAPMPGAGLGAAGLAASAAAGATGVTEAIGSGLPSAGAAGAAPGAQSAGNELPKTLVITSGVAAGTSIPLDEAVFTIGRSSDSTLVIVDEYTSTYHARLTRGGTGWVLADLDSTNGTKLDGERVTKPVEVPPYTPVTIGTTTFELRP